jgi:hypothetical protein
LYTIVDGIVYFEREKDAAMHQTVTAEKARLVQKMLGDKKSGVPTRPATPSYQVLLTCGDHDHEDGIATIYENQKD